MKIAKQEDYALILMCELARTFDNQPLPLSQIAHVHGLSLLYLKKIARLLKLADLITSKEGVHGGYTLKKPPQLISAWDVLAAVNKFTSQKDIRISQGECPLFTQCLPQHIKKTVIRQLEQSFRTVNLVTLLSPV